MFKCYIYKFWLALTVIRTTTRYSINLLETASRLYLFLLEKIYSFTDVYMYDTNVSTSAETPANSFVGLLLETWQVYKSKGKFQTIHVSNFYFQTITPFPEYYFFFAGKYTVYQQNNALTTHELFNGGEENVSFLNNR